MPMITDSRGQVYGIIPCLVCAAGNSNMCPVKNPLDCGVYKAVIDLSVVVYKYGLEDEVEDLKKKRKED